MNSFYCKFILSIVVLMFLISCAKPDDKLLHFAQTGDLENLIKALNEGANINAKDNDGSTALIKATYSGKINIINFLIMNIGANVNVKDLSGKNALMYAKTNYIVKILIDNGALINEIDNSGKTALMYAVENCVDTDLSIPKMLLDKGANIDAKDSNGKTALMYSVSLKKIVCSEFLIEKGADVNNVNKYGSSVLMYASDSEGESKGNLKVVQFLINKGAVYDEHYKTKTGYTYLMSFCNRHFDDYVRELIIKGADVNQKCEVGDSPLIIAARRGSFYKSNIDITEILLKNGANINVIGQGGYNSLMEAIHSEDIMLAKFLIDNGINVNLKCKRGMTAIEHAEQVGRLNSLRTRGNFRRDDFQGLVDYLKNHGAK